MSEKTRELSHNGLCDVNGCEHSAIGTYDGSDFCSEHIARFGVVMEPQKQQLRPSHYKKGEDTFAWAERKFEPDTCLAIAAFNIHKYNDRSKGDDYKDFGKIADYAMWARSIMEKTSEK